MIKSILIIVYLVLVVLVVLTFIFTGDARAAILWPLLVVIWFFVGIFKAIDYTHTKIDSFKENHRKRKEPPSPTEIIRGIIALQVVKNYNKWYTAGSELRWKFKNISIIKNSHNQLSVKVGNDNVTISTKLAEAIDKSIQIHKDFEANKARHEKEQRMLDALEEFMGSEDV